MDSMAVQKFSRTLFNIHPDIALSVAKTKTIFTSEMRSVLPQVNFHAIFSKAPRIWPAQFSLQRTCTLLSRVRPRWKSCQPRATCLSSVHQMPLKRHLLSDICI